MDEDTAGLAAVEAYFSAYGSATVKHVQYWLGNGLGVRRKGLNRWIEQLGDRLVKVEVETETCLVLREHLDELLATEESPTVRLLPAVDQWVMGPGTADRHVTPVARRGVVTRGSNFAISAGVVAGTWKLMDDVVSVDWFAEAGAMPRDAVASEVDRLGKVLDKPLTFSG